MLDVLAPWRELRLPIIGLEPSCLYTLRDEFKAMIPGRETSELASLAMLFEEFIAHEADAGRLSLKLRSVARTALLHGHCHQKAFGAMPAAQRALALVPDLKVTTIESSCCGMAGAFGYEAEHYEMSIKMGEAALLPAVRAAPASKRVATPPRACSMPQRAMPGRGSSSS